jgi:hypothetical protein
MKVPTTSTLLLFASLTALVLIGVVAIGIMNEGTAFKGCVNGKGSSKALASSNLKCFLVPNLRELIGGGGNTVVGSVVR